MPAERRCPALLVAAPASGQGKTTLTAGLARLHRAQGRRVRVFKCGPDFLDPAILARASGAPVYNLDLWMVGERACRRLLWEAAGEADLILVEGVMGLFDGRPSSADLAECLGLPVLAVIDAHAMAQTFAALAWGLARFRPALSIAGVVANGVAGEDHARLLRESLPPVIPWLGALPRESAFALPERHLGLVRAEEIADLDARLEAAARVVAEAGVTSLPSPAVFQPEPIPEPPRLLEGVRIGVARDAAFSFLYPANLDLLRALGAQVEFFSPLADTALPEVDALWLPGGYPELHLERLAANRAMHEALRAHHAAGKPILAECGGMLYLFEELRDAEGRGAPMVGLLPGRATMQTRLAALGLQALDTPQGEIRGHSFHYSRAETPLEPWQRCRHQRQGRPGEGVYRLGRLTASYLHLYFPSNPAATAALFCP
ncbi:MAG: hydrogenobyrinate a,c-diamide synthase [Porticoccaceae bacterium]|nr:MAG: hydrogenobyrinate a,c-diamide synthase [Porticoccaceae bacterium]